MDQNLSPLSHRGLSTQKIKPVEATFKMLELHRYSNFTQLFHIKKHFLPKGVGTSSLLVEKRFEDITVQELCDPAIVRRALL